MYDAVLFCGKCVRFICGFDLTKLRASLIKINLYEHLSVNKLSLICLSLSDWLLLVSHWLAPIVSRRLIGTCQLSQNVRVRCACV